MHATVFMAMSLDGFIAGLDGDVSWLDQCGVPDAPLGDAADMGFLALMRDIDCLLMGRGTAEKLASFQLTAEQWPYGDTPIYILSNSLQQRPSLPGNTHVLQGSLAQALAELRQRGHQHVYVDGGALVRSCIEAGLVRRLVITLAPIVLGQGTPLFAGLSHAVKLRQMSVTRYANEFVQLEYAIEAAESPTVMSVRMLQVAAGAGLEADTTRRGTDHA